MRASETGNATNSMSTRFSTNPSWSGLEINQVRTTPHFAAGKNVVEQPSLCLTISGRAMVTWTAEKKAFQKRLTPGGFVYWAPGYELIDANVMSSLTSLSVVLDPVKINHWTEGDPTFKITSISALPPHIVGSDPYIARLINNMHSDLLQGCPAGKLFGESASLALVSYLYGNYSRPFQEKVANGLSSTKLKVIEEYIYANLASDLTLAEMASLIGLSPRHFCRSFSLATGTPPHQYILRARIEMAKIMLTTTKHPVTEIAMKLGFASTSHFSDAFRKVVGISPTKYLEQH